MIESKASAIEDIIRPALYVVATPIGHLADISLRALSILAKVDAIAAEDTRHSKQLLNHYGIENRLFSVHDHNESAQIEFILAELRLGKAIALISDAGTPLISDPGYKLVRALRQAQFRIIPIPGPSAVMTALSVAGIATDRFTFLGFLPAKQAARSSALTEWREHPATIVCYESTHRIIDCLTDMASVFGVDRQAVLAKELTKPFEALINGTFAELLAWLEADPKRQKGEFVLIIEGAKPNLEQDYVELDRLLKLLLEDLPLKSAVKMAARFSGLNKNLVYERALTLQV